MSKLTLDAAIKHCLEVAEQNETQADKWQEEGGEQWGKTIACRECAADHRQLAAWLTELKQLKAIIAGYDDVNMQKLEMVLAMIRIGSEGAWAKIEREKELKEAKRLLKAAVEDFSYIGSTGTCIGGNCERCPLEGEKQNSRYACTNWKHADEALALIGEDGEQNG